MLEDGRPQTAILTENVVIKASPLGCLLLTRINFNPGMPVGACPVKYGMKLLIHSQTSTVVSEMGPDVHVYHFCVKCNQWAVQSMSII